MNLSRIVGRGTGRLAGVVTTLLRRLAARVWSRETFLALGSASFLLAVLVVALPAAWLPPVVTRAGEVFLANRRAVLVGGVLAGGFGVWALYHQQSPADDGPTVTVPERPPEFAYFTNHRSVGESIDRSTSDEDLERWQVGKFRRETYNQLYEAAVTAISEAEDCAPQIARDALAEGTWTDSPRAARFLGDESETELPLSVRIRDWASGESYRRYVRDTVAAIAAIDPEHDNSVLGNDVNGLAADDAENSANDVGDGSDTDDTDPSDAAPIHTADVALEAGGERV